MEKPEHVVRITEQIQYTIISNDKLESGIGTDEVCWIRTTKKKRMEKNCLNKCFERLWTNRIDRDFTFTGCRFNSLYARTGHQLSRVSLNWASLPTTSTNTSSSSIHLMYGAYDKQNGITIAERWPNVRIRRNRRQNVTKRKETHTNTFTKLINYA